MAWWQKGEKEHAEAGLGTSGATGAEGGRAGAGLGSSEESSELIAYLMSRFMLVLIAVMLVEVLVVWVESLVLVPMLRDALNNSQATQATTSIVTLLRGVFLLLFSMAQADYVGMVSFARRSMTVLLLLLLLFLLAMPPLFGAFAFSRMVANKIRGLQARREQELAQIDQQRSQFLTDIAHDLRTPLMAISGMAHAILDGVVRDDAMRDQYLQSISDKADKLGGLVSSVFDYTKLGSGSFSLERKEIDLSQLLLNEAATAYADIEDAGMQFSVHVDEERCPVYADPVQLGRVVANLLTNAVRHNKPGTEIALMLVRQAGVAYVLVGDTGDAITDDPDALFQPFTRGDAARTGTPGSGLGLSICKRIAELHGYDLSLVQPYGRFAKAFVLRCNVL